MASEKDLELLDDYIGNRLKSGEREAFEARLKADTELQNELRVQQQIVESLRKARAAELKSILNNIPLSSIPAQTSSLSRWAGAASVVIVAAAVYFYLSLEHDEKSAIVPDTTSVEVPAQEPESTTTVEPEKVAPSEGDEGRARKSPRVRPSAKQSTDTNPTEEARTQSKPNIDVFDPSTEEETDSNIARMEIPGALESRSKSDIPTEINSRNKSYPFHYQFKDQKLILYGPFDKNLYEILEFISGDDESTKKRTIFLYYKANYYLLNQAGDKIKTLSPVNDPALLQKLKESRNQP